MVAPEYVTPRMIIIHSLVAATGGGCSVLGVSGRNSIPAGLLWPCISREMLSNPKFLTPAEKVNSYRSLPPQVLKSPGERGRVSN